jgi:hypothetical protein
MLKLPLDKSEKLTLAVDLEHIVHRQFHNEGINRTGDVSIETKQRIATVVAEAICKKLKAQALSLDIINETKAKAHSICTTRETWYYRDWQSSLGDIMLTELSGASRRFDVLGFGAFESIWLSSDENARIWLLRLNEIVDDLDISVTDDCRVKQLQKIFHSTASLVTALASISTNREIISKKTLAAAKLILTPNN